MHKAADADRVVHLMTETGERKVAIAKGLKKATSRKGAALDILNLVSAKLTTGKSSLSVITEAKIIQVPTVFKQQLNGLFFLQAVSEMIDVFIQEDFEQTSIPNNLENIMQVKSDLNLPLLLGAFALRLLYIAGELPKLNEDTITGEQILPGQQRYLNHDTGYTTVQSRASSDPISDRIYKTQRFILKRDFHIINKVELTGSEQQQLLGIHLTWIRNLIGKDLPACNLFVSITASNGK